MLDVVQNIADPPGHNLVKSSVRINLANPLLSGVLVNACNAEELHDKIIRR